jgi:ubiquinone/menaquinone biosynthesis C-methylase UbiE
MHHIAAHVPPGAVILDAGGGPGRYTIELARRGYEVVLLDLSEGLLELAKAQIKAERADVQARVKDVVLGDILDLARFVDQTFDVVLCLDPLTYLPQPGQRTRALRELTRVTKPQGLVALSVRGHVAVLRTILRLYSDELTNGSIEAFTASGTTTAGGVPSRYFRAQELRELAEGHGLQTILMAGAEGLSDGLPEATNALFKDREKWETWKQLVMTMSTDPTVVDMSGHMLYLGRKPQSM